MADSSWESFHRRKITSGRSSRAAPKAHCSEPRVFNQKTWAPSPLRFMRSEIFFISWSPYYPSYLARRLQTHGICWYVLQGHAAAAMLCPSQAAQHLLPAAAQSSRLQKSFIKQTALRCATLDMKKNKKPNKPTTKQPNKKKNSWEKKKQHWHL